MIYSFEPIFDSNSRVLILGSMASKKSLEKGFYYMHPRNRFWSTVSKVVGEPAPESIDDKKAWLLKHNIALMDIIYSCNRKGSLDSDIKDVVPNDISEVIKTGNIQAIYCNGRKSFETAKKAYPHIDFIYLPSTSPANAGSWNIDEWLKIRDCLRNENK
ncbi:MAG: DNA-deoxyinosine glycosylase [Clostridia bacterium]|nr:DNA-deoxyinosine glycosylase [Clostridia bacterium]MDE7329318.1 DNA-deoxyinosine glycosylase [Clostridia bacterium]